MRKRGYDVVQVRNFLREIANEMRARQEVRARLASDGDPESVVGERARQIVERAEAEAQRIIAEARTAASAQVSEGHDEADRIVEEARAAADEIADSAESSARERSAAVLAETQSRLDQLLAEERDVRRALSTLSPDVTDDATDTEITDGVDLVPERDVVDPESGIDESLADFMKATLRNELRPE